MDPMWLLLMGHLLGDYALQTDRMAQQKGSSPFDLSVHVLIYVGCIAVATLVGLRIAGGAFPWLLLVSLSVALYLVHWLQDFAKSRYFSGSRQAYYADQALHLLQLMVVRWLVFA